MLGDIIMVLVFIISALSKIFELTGWVEGVERGCRNVKEWKTRSTRLNPTTNSSFVCVSERQID